MYFDLGDRRGRLQVIERVRKIQHDYVYLCVCDCGTMKEIKGDTLRRVQSCGCLQRESAAESGRRNRKTGKTIDGSGYVVFSSKSLFPDVFGMREHRAVMEAHLGRPLTNDEVVHHINEDRQDNRLENLEVLGRAEHVRRHGKGRMLKCKCCNKETWYGPATMSKMTHLQDGQYHCRKCSRSALYDKTCKRCSEAFRGKLPTQFCAKCTKKRVAKT